MSSKGKAVLQLLTATRFLLVHYPSLKEKVQDLGMWVLGREGKQGPNRLFSLRKHKTRTLKFKSTLNRFLQYL